MSNDIPNQQELVEKWSKTANDLLAGLKVKRAYYMPPKSVEAMGWRASPVVIELTDPDDASGEVIRLFPMQDDEGNNAGALATSDQEDPVLPVIWK